MTVQDQAELVTKNVGLRGIVVADSTISNVDGENGILIYRGYDILPLATEGTYEEVVYLLLRHELPGREQLQSLVAISANPTIAIWSSPRPAIRTGTRSRV